MNLSIFILFIASAVNAEPARWGFIIKDKQCSEYWQGDECVSYSVPSGWTEFYGNKKGAMKHHGKTCKVFNDKKKCCEQMGLTYVKLILEKKLINSNLDECKNRL